MSFLVFLEQMSVTARVCPLSLQQPSPFSRIFSKRLSGWSVTWRVWLGEGCYLVKWSPRLNSRVALGFGVSWIWGTTPLWLPLDKCLHRRVFSIGILCVSRTKRGVPGLQPQLAFLGPSVEKPCTKERSQWCPFCLFMAGGDTLAQKLAGAKFKFWHIQLFKNNPKE